MHTAEIKRTFIYLLHAMMLMKEPEYA